MKIIVTGGAGFIASHIADAYIAKGHSVAIIDNLHSGFKKNLNPCARFYKTDIRDKKEVEKIFGKEKPEIVNHHAAMISVVESMRNPGNVFDTNILGSVNLLTAFGKHKRGPHPKFIFASTGGALYGDPKKIPADENTPIDPLSAYGLSKFLTEKVIEFYAREYHFSYLVLRYANVFGPRQNPSGEAGVVAIFSMEMRKSIRPTIFGDGTKTRDYVYVGDIVQVNVRGLTKGANVAVNIGNSVEVSDQKVFDAIARELHFTKKPIYAPYREGEVYRMSLNASKAKKVLGWKPTVKFDKGIELTVTTL